MGKHLVLIFCAVAVTVYVGILIAAYSFQRHLLYWPNPGYGEAASGYSRIAAKTDDGLTLVGWFSPPLGQLPTIMFFHGNAESAILPGRLDKIENYKRLSYGIYIASYRGWDGNQGQPTEQGLYKDARAAITALGNQGILPQDIIINGESLGTGIAIQMATEFSVKALILENPYTSIAAVAQYHYKILPAYWLVKDRYDSLSKISQITSPMLLLNAENDTTVPPAMGQILAKKNPTWTKTVSVNGAGHNNIYGHGAFTAIETFLKSLRS